MQRKGYVSQVTAGPKTGFGLMTSDDGIAFYNKQQFTSVTPIWDFQNRIAPTRRASGPSSSTSSMPPPTTGPS